MGRFMAAMYERVTRDAEEACLRQWRSELLASLGGRVLEVGAGTGLNVPHYGRGVAHVVLSEPDPWMRRRLADRVRTDARVPAAVVDASIEHLPFPDGTFDAVVATLVLCSVPDQARALAEIRRVLAPGGRFAFIEHVAAVGRPRRLKWQRRLEPLWKHAAGNCHLARNTEQAISAAGFSLERITRESMRKVVPVVRPTIRGIALSPRARA